jgi:hypothetical protein
VWCSTRVEPKDPVEIAVIGDPPAGHETVPAHHARRSLMMANVAKLDARIIMAEQSALARGLDRRRDLGGGEGRAGQEKKRVDDFHGPRAAN